MSGGVPTCANVDHKPIIESPGRVIARMDFYRLANLGLEGVTLRWTQNGSPISLAIAQHGGDHLGLRATLLLACTTVRQDEVDKISTMHLGFLRFGEQEFHVSENSPAMPGILWHAFRKKYTPDDFIRRRFPLGRLASCSALQAEQRRGSTSRPTPCPWQQPSHQNDVVE